MSADAFLTQLVITLGIAFLLSSVVSLFILVRSPQGKGGKNRRKLGSDLGKQLPSPEPRSGIYARPQIFLSFMDRDTQFALNLAQDLRFNGFEVWIALEQMKVGEPLRSTIENALEESDWLVFVISSYSAESKGQLLEWDIASLIEEERGRFLLPVVADKEVSIAENRFLKDKVYADFRGNYNSGLMHLLASLRP